MRTLDSRPLLTQACTTGFVCGLGDVIAQTLIEKRQLKSYNVRRTATMGAIGFFFTGPVLGTWYVSLDRLVGPTKTTRDALKKVFLDQVVFAPALFAVLLPLFGFSQGMNAEQVKDKVSKEYFNMLLGFYKLWPAAQVINFYVIPLKFRVNFSNIVSLFWNTYVSWLANRPVTVSMDSCQSTSSQSPKQ